MRRNALRTFFERIVVATLPLAACGGDPATPPEDLAIADLSDFAVTGDDPILPPFDWCELANPPYSASVDPDLGLSPDGGYAEYGTLCYYKTVCNTVCKTGYNIC